VLFPALLLGATASSVFAQQTTDGPGAPRATQTIDGRSLPHPLVPFGGDSTLHAGQAKPSWPARLLPPQDTPSALGLGTFDGPLDREDLGTDEPSPRLVAQTSGAPVIPKLIKGTLFE